MEFTIIKNPIDIKEYSESLCKDFLQELDLYIEQRRKESEKLANNERSTLLPASRDLLPNVFHDSVYSLNSRKSVAIEKVNANQTHNNNGNSNHNYDHNTFNENKNQLHSRVDLTSNINFSEIKNPSNGTIASTKHRNNISNPISTDVLFQATRKNLHEERVISTNSSVNITNGNTSSSNSYNDIDEAVSDITAMNTINSLNNFTKDEIFWDISFSRFPKIFETKLFDFGGILWRLSFGNSTNSVGNSTAVVLGNSSKRIGNGTNSNSNNNSNINYYYLKLSVAELLSVDESVTIQCTYRLYDHRNRCHITSESYTYKYDANNSRLIHGFDRFVSVEDAQSFLDDSKLKISMTIQLLPD